MPFSSLSLRLRWKGGLIACLFIDMIDRVVVSHYNLYVPGRVIVWHAQEIATAECALLLATHLLLLVFIAFVAPPKKTRNQ